MQSISKIHTPCKNCVFSIYENITQTGCALNYLEKYRTNGVSIIDVYDEEKEFYVINDKKCIGYRENKWFSQYGLDHASIDQKINKFHELNHIDYLMLVDLKNFDDEGLSNLHKAINETPYKPSKIVFVRYHSNKNFPYEKIKDFFDNTNLNCKWRIQTMVDDSLSNKDILHNITNLNKGYRFILSINKPIENINSILSKANKIVYEDLGSVVAIKNAEGSGVLFSAPSYRWSIVVEKIDILTNENNYIII